MDRVNEGEGVVGVAGALLVSQDPDPEDAQDMVVLRVPGHGLTLDRIGTSRSGVKGPGVDAGESSDLRRSGAGAMKTMAWKPLRS
jgi:hypothetical protein